MLCPLDDTIKTGKEKERIERKDRKQNHEKEKVLPSVWKRNWIRESILIIILVVLTSFMLINVNNIQGSARVVNYAGIVRGATQRLVKLELSGNQMMS